MTRLQVNLGVYVIRKGMKILGGMALDVARVGFWCRVVRFHHFCISFILGASSFPAYSLISFRRPFLA